MNNMVIYCFHLTYYEHFLMFYYLFFICFYYLMFSYLLFCLILTQTPWCSYFDAHLHEQLRLQWGKMTCSRSPPARGGIGYKLVFSKAFSTPCLPLRKHSQFYFFLWQIYRKFIAAKYLLSVSGCCSKIESIMTHSMYCITWWCTTSI